jgi:hypothetical protein
LGVRTRKDIAYSIVNTRVPTTPWDGPRPVDLAKDLLGNGLSSAAATKLATIDKDDRLALSFLFSTPEYLRW